MVRKKENKSAKIRALLDKGMLQRDIARKLKVSAQLVYIGPVFSSGMIGVN